MRQKKEIDWDTVNALRERGVGWAEIASTLHIPRGTLTCQNSRRKAGKAGGEFKPQAAKVVIATEDRRPGLDVYTPREIFKHLHKLGYRVEGKVYMMTKQYVNLQSVISE